MSTAASEDERRLYRDRLLPLLDDCLRRGSRMAIFGAGPHTDFLFELVPELDMPALVAILDSHAADGDPRTVHGRPMRSLAWAREHVDVVLCSSFNNEVDQLLLLGSAGLQGLFSHRPALIVANPATIVVPVEAGYVMVPPEDDAAPLREIAARFDREGEAMRALVAALGRFDPELAVVPAAETGDGRPWWDNKYFTGDDARCAHGLVRLRRPKRVIEIGSGMSTRFMALALATNADDGELVAIDPLPRSAVAGLCTRHIASNLQRTPLETFDGLEAGDIVFFDGSHLALQGSDCAHFFLRLLPRFPAGVLVHVHDIFLPDAYPPDMWPLRYNEQHLLAALLLGGEVWRPVLAVHHLNRQGVLTRGGSSFWMEKM